MLKTFDKNHFSIPSGISQIGWHSAHSHRNGVERSEIGNK